MHCLVFKFSAVLLLSKKMLRSIFSLMQFQNDFVTEILNLAAVVLSLIFNTEDNPYSL